VFFRHIPATCRLGGLAVSDTSKVKGFFDILSVEKSMDFRHMTQTCRFDRRV